MIQNPEMIIEKDFVSPVTEEQIQMNGIDLRVESVQSIEGVVSIFKDSKQLPNYINIKSEVNLNKGKIWKLEPGKAYLLQIAETIKIPEGMCAMVWMRSTFNRSGIPIFACVFDSGYEGKPTFTAYPTIPLYLEKGTRVAQIVYFNADTAKMYVGQYQGEGIKKE